MINLIPYQYIFTSRWDMINDKWKLTFISDGSIVIITFLLARHKLRAWIEFRTSFKQKACDTAVYIIDK